MDWWTVVRNDMDRPGESVYKVLLDSMYEVRGVRNDVGKDEVER